MSQCRISNRGSSLVFGLVALILGACAFHYYRAHDPAYLVCGVAGGMFLFAGACVSGEEEDEEAFSLPIVV